MCSVLRVAVSRCSCLRHGLGAGVGALDQRDVVGIGTRQVSTGTGSEPALVRIGADVLSWITVLAWGDHPGPGSARLTDRMCGSGDHGA